MIHHQLGAAIASAATSAQLDQLAGTLWRAYAAGQIAEDQAQSLGEAVETRRQALRWPEKGPSALRVAIVRGETQSAASEAPRPAPGLRRNGPRQLVLRIPRPAFYDRTRSIERRRGLAASGCAYRELRPHILMIEPAKKRHGLDATHALNRAAQWRSLAQSQVGPHAVVVGCVS